MTTAPFAADVPARVRSALFARRPGFRLCAALGLFATLMPSAPASAQQTTPPTTQRTPPTVQQTPPTVAPESTPPVTDVPPSGPMLTPPAEPGVAESGETPPEPEAPIPPLPSTPEQKLEITNDLANVESRLMQLDYERRDEGHIAGPVAMLSVGYGMALVSTAVALGSYFSAEAARDWDIGDEYKGRLDVNDDGIIDDYDENAYRRIARSFSIVGGVSAAVGIVGSVLLAKRLQERRENEPERRSLERRRRELRRQLDYATNVGPRDVQLSLTGRF